MLGAREPQEKTGEQPSSIFKSWQGPWHKAKTITIGVGVTNDWLATQGAMSLKTL